MLAETELPAEIIDLIIDGLVDEADPTVSINDLRACALVCKAFCMGAHRNLFSNFKISISFPSNSDNKPQYLLDLLKSSLDFFGLGIIYHLRTVSLVLEFEDLRLSRGNNLFDAVFPDILDILHGPHHGISGLSLDLQVKDHNGQRSGDWSRFSPRFNRAFHDLCCSTDVTTLRLKHLLNVPKSILRGSHIRHLELHVIHFSDGDAYIKEDPTRRYDVIQPESLVLPTYWLLPTVVVALEGNMKPVLEFNDRFQLAFAYLTDLTITIVNHNRPAYLYLMPQLHSLRLLHLFTYSRPTQIVHPVIDFFSYPDNTIPSSLRHLIMEVRADYYTLASEPGMREMRENPSGWPAFDSRLSGSEFRKVQDIRLVVRFLPQKGAHGVEMSLEEIVPVVQCREIILRHLPRLVDIRPTTFFLDLALDE